MFGDVGGGVEEGKVRGLWGVCIVLGLVFCF